MNEVVVQDAGKAVLDDLNVKSRPYRDEYHTVDSVYLVSSLTERAMSAGLTVFNSFSMEDVVLHDDKVCGLVLNWGPVHRLDWPVDPICVHSRYVIDATGHPSSVAAVLVKKMGVRLATETGGIVGERSMDAEKGEMQTPENTVEIYPGLYVSGMAANAVCGGYRMGAVFGGMLLSGQKAAWEILKKLGK